MFSKKSDKRHKSDIQKSKQIMIVGHFHTDIPLPKGECPFCGILNNPAVGGIGFTHKDDCQNPIVLDIRK